MRLVALTSLLVAASFVAANATELRLASWNIQTLTMPGERVFDDQPPLDLRTSADMLRLQKVRDAIKADVFILQEISSVRALAQVFPQPEWTICVSGQYRADEMGLGPTYANLPGIEPMCVAKSGEALPDPEPGELRRQYVAVAVHKAAGFDIAQISDAPSISVPFDDRGVNPGDPAVVRNVRWGLDVTITGGTQTWRVLGVHMKTGCFTDGLVDPASGSPWQHDNSPDKPCQTYGRQAPALKTWIDQAAKGKVPFAVVGDFNRRLAIEADDKTRPDLLPILTGAQTTDPADDIALSIVPEKPEEAKACWPEENGTAKEHSIDFMVFGPGMRPANWRQTYEKVRYVDIATIGGTSLKQAIDSPHLSDHCPIVLDLG